MDPCPPERLVGVDVPEARGRALIEERSLDRRAAAGEPARERPRREAGFQGLVADARLEVRVQLARLEHQPRAEAPYVSVRDVRSVV
jgi:hypothetical protein